MALLFALDHRIEFLPASSEEILRSVPTAPGVFCLRGESESAEPYITRTADLRRRLKRLLAPPEEVDADGQPVLSRRLNLRDRVRWIEWTRTGSEFESHVVLYHATCAAFGAERARKRLRLYPPFCVRLTATHEHPRLYVTNRLSRRSMPECFGPFPSRAAAERYAEAVLDLFKLRRCYEDLEPYPEHPGCAYGEMKRCLAPCKVACTGEDYARESEQVRQFLLTRGESLLNEIAALRDAASEAMDFENAAALHARWEKVKAAAALADELVAPVLQVRALVVQTAAPPPDDGPKDEAALFLLERGRLCGPERLSTLGVRAVREQTAVGSSLFAQPLMLAAVPLQEPAASAQPGSEKSDAGHTEVASGPEDRARISLGKLEASAQVGSDPDPAQAGDALAVFRRWYYRPEKSRSGEVFLPNPDGGWPIRRILNGAARVVLGPPAEAAPVDREGAKELKTRMLHAGREGVERAVPVLPKRSRARKSVLPNDVIA